MLPELGMTVGYATTWEVTAINRDFADFTWDAYYDYLDATPGPTISVIMDVGTRPGHQYFVDGFWEAGEIAEGADR
jgi:hypothetical protein